MMDRKIYRYSAHMFFLMFSFFITSGAYAGGPHLVPDEGNKKATGDYVLNDFVLIALNVAKWVLILSGSLALLAFIYGGFMFILSHGNKSWVDKGKESLIGATIGLVVVLLAYTAIDYFLTKLGYNSGAFGGDWNKLK